MTLEFFSPPIVPTALTQPSYLTMAPSTTLLNESVIGAAGPATNLADSIQFKWNDASARTFNLTQSGAGSIALTFGATPSTIGDIRFPTGGTFGFRNTTNTGNLYLFNSGDALVWTGSIFSLGTNPALSGALNLANNAAIGWRNAANNGEFYFYVNSSDVLAYTGASFSIGANPAAAGAIRLPNGTQVAWRNVANSADAYITLTGTPNYIRIVNADLAIDTAGAPLPLGGAVRLHNNYAITWRNTANSADLALYVANISDSLTFNGPSFTLGVTPALTGAIRLPVLSYIVSRNGANTADIALLGVNGSNVEIGSGATSAIYIGSVSAGVVQISENGGAYNFDGQFFPNTDANLNLGIATTNRWANLFLSASVQIGTTPATTGAIRLSTNYYITWRNAANSANLNALGVGGADEINIGLGTAYLNVVAGGQAYLWLASALYPGTDGVGSIGLTTNRWLSANFSASVAIGTTPATVGAVRLANNTGIYFRDAGNTANYGLTFTTGDGFRFSSQLEISPYGAAVSSSGGLRLENTSLIGWRNAGNSGNLTFGVNASDQFVFAGGVVSLGSSGVLIPGGYLTVGGVTVAASGDIRVRNNAVVLAARNAANNADLNVLIVNSDDSVGITPILKLGTALAIGATPSTTGLIRVPNNSAVISGRNAANGANINFLNFGSDDSVTLGAGAAYVNLNAPLTYVAQLNITDGQPIVLGTTTGTKIGTATTQKLAFYNSTPIVQGAAVADAAGGATIDAEARTALNALLARIRSLGLIAA